MRSLFLKHVAQTNLDPMIIEVERASGVEIFDTNGKSYLDLIAGISVSSLGHCHPAIVDAVQKQAATYMHTLVYGEHVQTPQVQLAQLLLAQLPDEIDNAYFVNSGSEATEGAMKLAKRYTGRQEIIAFNNSYHGSSQGAMSLNSDPYFTAAYQPLLPNINFIDCNDFQGLNQITEKTAAVIIEPIRAEAGIEIPDPNYYVALNRRCKALGVLLILDEIQTGFGRTGKMFGFQHYDIQPDIVLMAKALGGGMPIGVFAAPKKIMHVLTDNPVLGHITTFGGHPVTCAAALAFLETLLKNRIVDLVDQKARQFKRYLKDVDGILEIRSKGLLMALELGDSEMVVEVVKKGLEAGIITDWFLFNTTSVRIAPPLIISESQIRNGCAMLKKIIESCKKSNQ